MVWSSMFLWWQRGWYVDLHVSRVCESLALATGVTMSLQFWWFGAWGLFTLSFFFLLSSLYTLSRIIVLTVWSWRPKHICFFSQRVKRPNLIFGSRFAGKNWLQAGPVFTLQSHFYMLGIFSSCHWCWLPGRFIIIYSLWLILNFYQKNI